MYKIREEERKKLRKYLACKNKSGEIETYLWSRVEWYEKIFRKIPGVTCICVCNSLAMNACHKDSDIDLFVITNHNRLWTARIWLTLLTSLLGIRKTSRKHASRFCLSFFISEDEEHFSHIAIEDDIYLSYWLETLIPIVNKNKAFERFLEKNKLEKIYKNMQSGAYSQHKASLLNSLSSKEREPSSNNSLVAFFPSLRRGLRQDFMGEGRVVRKFMRSIGDCIESLLKKIFLKKTLKSYERLGKPFGVIISDTMLKFHDQDRRKEIRDRVL